MADSKITALTENTTPVLTDLLPMVDDPAGTPATQKITVSTLADLFTSNSLYRQALINGNFDVWQRGTTLTYTAFARLADAWAFYNTADGGTLPTLVYSRQLLTSGDIPGSYYCFRLAPNGAGTSLGNATVSQNLQKIENATRYLCGASKTVTLSFYAKASVASKKIGVNLYQDYGTGGSPSAQEILTGEAFTLTSSWVKYTKTFTTNTLSGKTFGTGNDDWVGVNFVYAWGSTTGTSLGLGAAETYGGNGTIDIAQVQLCAGSVALPFMPKSFEEELRACQRYFETSYSYGVTVPTNSSTAGIVNLKVASNTVATTEHYGSVHYRVIKRTTPTPVIYPYTTATNTGRVSDCGAGTDLAASSGLTNYTGTGGFLVYNGTGGTLTTTRLAIMFHWSAEAEL